MTNFENLAYLLHKDVQEILVKNKHNNNVYLAGISCVGNNVELYNIDVEDGSDDIIISIKDFDENYIFTWHKLKSMLYYRCSKRKER